MQDKEEKGIEELYRKDKIKESKDIFLQVRIKILLRRVFKTCEEGIFLKVLREKVIV